MASTAKTREPIETGRRLALPLVGSAFHESKPAGVLGSLARTRGTHLLFSKSPPPRFASSSFLTVRHGRDDPEQEKERTGNAKLSTILP